MKTMWWWQLRQVRLEDFDPSTLGNTTGHYRGNRLGSRTSIHPPWVIQQGTTTGKQARGLSTHPPWVIQQGTATGKEARGLRSILPGSYNVALQRANRLEDFDPSTLHNSTGHYSGETSSRTSTHPPWRRQRGTTGETGSRTSIHPP